MNNNQNKEISKSQEDLILKDLLAMKRVSPLSALKDYQCFRLASRIYGLRDKGYNNIKKEMVWNKDKTKRYAEYFIPLT